MLTIRPATLSEFLDFPYQLYKDDPYWVPPLRMAQKTILSLRHPVYQQVKTNRWMAFREGKAVGRISSLYNLAHNEFHQEKCGFFGHFECINDKEVAEKLFTQVRKDLKNWGADFIRGPMNPTTNYECGLLVDGHDDPPQLAMTYNFAYYQDLMLGLEKEKDLIAWEVPPSFTPPPMMLQVLERTEKAHQVTWRKFDRSQFNRDLELVREIYNSAWERNWGFVPMNPGEFDQLAKEFKHVLNENLAIFTFVKGRPAGFILTLPDYNQVFHRIKDGKLFPSGFLKLLRPKKYINRCRTFMLGTKPEYRKLGLSALMILKSQGYASANYKSAEVSWILEDNLEMNKILDKITAKPYKTYRIYRGDL